MNDMVTTKQAAELLGVTAGRVRQMVLAGELAAEKMGRDLLIKRKDVEKVRGRPGPGRPKKGEADE